MPTGEFSEMARNCASLSRSRSSASWRAVTSRVTPSSAVIRPLASRNGDACVSSRRGVPFSPTMSNCRSPDSPANTRAVSSRNAARCPGTISVRTVWFATCSNESASSMRSPAGFISRSEPSSASSFRHSGSFSTIARNRASRTASSLFACSSCSAFCLSSRTRDALYARIRSSCAFVPPGVTSPVRGSRRVRSASIRVNSVASSADAGMNASAPSSRQRRSSANSATVSARTTNGTRASLLSVRQ